MEGITKKDKFKAKQMIIKDFIYNKLNKIKQTISRVLPEIFIVLGLFFIVYITFKLSFVAGMYLTGCILLLIGVLLAIERR